MRVLQVDRRAPFTPPRSPLCRSNLFVGVGVRWGAVWQHQSARRTGRSDVDLPHASLASRGLEGCRAARARYMDPMSLWRSAPMVCLRRQGQRPILRQEGRRAVPRWRSVRVPKVLCAGLRQPAGRLSVSQPPQIAEHQDAARRQSRPLCAFSRQAPPHASAHLSPSSGAGEGRRDDHISTPLGRGRKACRRTPKTRSPLQETAERRLVVGRSFQLIITRTVNVNRRSR